VNVGLRADDVAALIEKKSIAGKAVFWRELISGQMDADRMDYHLRDSLHAGVQYGRFDLHRLLTTVVAAVQRGPEGDPIATRLGVSEGGWHSAEALVLARYFMFTQVYFHKTRVAYDIHLKGAMAELLPGRLFPKPIGGELAQYLLWDDWRVLGALGSGGGGDHGRRLVTRDHYKTVFHTREAPSLLELDELQELKAALGDLVVAEAHAEKSWYKTGNTDIQVVSEARDDMVAPLSEHSPVVKSLPSSNKVALYTTAQDAAKARALREQFFQKKREGRS